jgi:hypothetical protein
MIHHISISAKEPRHVAGVLAEIMGGQVVPAPPHFPEDSWFLLTGDEYGTLVEVLPDGAEIRPNDEEAGFGVTPGRPPYVATHAYISVPASAERVVEIGEREGWLTRRCDRGPFDLIECWVENRLMIEFAPPEMARKYLDLFTNPAALRAALAQFAPEAQLELAAA